MLRQGRDNLALTIMVPYDCDNNCKFCISKKLYAEHKPNKEKVLQSTKAFFKSEYKDMIKDVVLTGGEPMQDIETLVEIIKLIPKDKKVFINTTLIQKNFDKFVELVNTNSKIKGINVSRHCIDYSHDCLIMQNIVADEEFKKFYKPVRINCVIGENTLNIEKIVSRWTELKHHDLEVSFRADFTKMVPSQLHNPYNKVPVYLATKGYRFVRHTFCDVCDTVAFVSPNGFPVRYHRGLKTTSKTYTDAIEVNDFIISQEGNLYYDWNFSTETLVELPIETTKVQHEYNRYGSPKYGYYRYSCGGGCGGPTRHFVPSCGGPYWDPSPYISSCGGSSGFSSCGGPYRETSYNCGGSYGGYC